MRNLFILLLLMGLSVTTAMRIKGFNDDEETKDKGTSNDVGSGEDEDTTYDTEDGSGDDGDDDDDDDEDDQPQRYRLSARPVMKELVGYWKVDWSSGGESSYFVEDFIEDRINKVEMRIASCDWKNTCATNKRAYVQPSRSSGYSYKDGWFEVDNVHDGTLIIFMKIEDDRLNLVWYRPLSGYKVTGIGTKDIFLPLFYDKKSDNDIDKVYFARAGDNITIKARFEALNDMRVQLLIDGKQFNKSSAKAFHILNGDVIPRRYRFMETTSPIYEAEYFFTKLTNEDFRIENYTIMVGGALGYDTFKFAIKKEPEPLREDDLIGNWDVKWSTGSKSSYSIQKSNSSVNIRITSCNWRTTCAVNKEAQLQPSTSVEYPYINGWYQVRDIHDGVLTIYMKKVNNELKMVWYRPLSGYMATGTGRKDSSRFITEGPSTVSTTETIEGVVGEHSATIQMNAALLDITAANHSSKEHSVDEPSLSKEVKGDHSTITDSKDVNKVEVMFKTTNCHPRLGCYDIYEEEDDNERNNRKDETGIDDKYLANLSRHVVSK